MMLCCTPAPYVAYCIVAIKEVTLAIIGDVGILQLLSPLDMAEGAILKFLSIPKARLSANSPPQFDASHTVVIADVFTRATYIQAATDLI